MKLCFSRLWKLWSVPCFCRKSWSVAALLHWSIPLFALLLLTSMISVGAHAATYTLPMSPWSGPFSSCSGTAPTISCSSNIDFGNDNSVVINVTQNLTLTISGNFQVKNNLCIYASPGTLNLDISGNFQADNNAGKSGTCSTALAVNISAGGNVDFGNNTLVTGNITAGGNITIDSGTVSGVCTPSTPNCTGTKNNQTITFGAQTSPRTYSSGGTFAISPTATASSGLTVTYSSTTSSVCTVSGTTVTMVAAGTCTIAANQAGNASYNAAPQVTQNVTISKANQATLTVTGPSSVTYGSTGALTSSGGSGSGAVTYSAGASTGCSVSGTTLSITNTSGTCVVTATKAADTNYNAATSATYTVALNKANQATLTVTGPSSVTYGSTGALTSSGGSGSGAVTYSIGSSTGCSLSGTTLSITNLSGTCAVTATKAADTNYNAATSASYTVTLSKASQTITFGAQTSPQTYSSGGTFAINPTATASSGLAVTYSSTTTSVCTVSGTTVTMVTTGTCTIAADQTGNSNYAAAAQVTQSVTIGKASQTITFGAQTSPRTYAVGGTFAINPTATASSGLAVTYSSTTTTICTVSGTTVNMTNASGTCTIAANQAGDGTYNAAPQVTQSVEIDPLLLSEWRMDETTAYSGVAGEVKNNLVGGTNATATNGATNGVGKVCRAAIFDGTNDYLTVAGLSSQLSGTASLSFWINTTQVGSNTPWAAPGVTGVEVGGAAPAGHNDIFWGYINATGKMGLHKGNTAGAQSTSSINNGTWRHIVLTRNTASPGESKIYVDGVLENTRNMADLNLVTTAFASLGRIQTPWVTGVLSGALDEVKVFAPVLSTTQVASIYANESAGKNWDGSARACPVSGPHHLEILHSSGTGLTCAASTLTVRACADAACTTPYTGGVSGTLTATGTPTVNWDGTTGGATGAGFVIAASASSVTKNVQVAAVGTVVFGTSSPLTPAASSATTCNFGSPSCTFTASSAGFLFSNTATGNTFTIPTQVAGTATPTAPAANAIYLRAVQSTTTNAAVCTPAIISQTGVDVTMGYSCNDPSSCSSGSLLTVNATPVPPSGGTVSMNFDANGSSPITLSYADVGQITVNASKSITPTGGTAVTLNGSSNAFVVKPGGFVLSNIKCTTFGATTCAPALAAPGNNPAAPDHTGAAFIQAGRNFSATVTATTTGGATTPNYGKETSPEGVKLTANLVLPAGGNAPGLTNPTAFGSFTSGQAAGTTFGWDEVGIITLTPSIGDGDYLGAGDVSGTTSGNVGRFIPDHFTLISPSIVSAFAYMAQPFTVNYTLEARNGLDAKTSNYTGAYAPGVVSVAAENANSGTDLVVSLAPRITGLTGSWSNGTYSVSSVNNATLARGSGDPDGPYDTLALGVKVTDTDGPVLQALDMNPTTGVADVACVSGGVVTNCTHKVIGTTKQRFGRLRLLNFYGSELLNARVEYRAEYWDGSRWTVNTLDNTSPIVAGNLATGGLTVNGITGLTSGVGFITFNAAGVGSHDIAANLNSSGDVTSCNASNPTGTTAANKEWLQGYWSGSCNGTAAWQQDPNARIKLGSPKAPYIYLRERY